MVCPRVGNPMMLKQFIVRAIEPGLVQQLDSAGQPKHWLIVANSLNSAWGKFTHQRFDALKPDPAAYDIALHRIINTEG